MSEEIKKITDLIKELQQFKEEHGDIKVVVQYRDERGDYRDVDTDLHLCVKKRNKSYYYNQDIEEGEEMLVL